MSSEILFLSDDDDDDDVSFVGSSLPPLPPALSVHTAARARESSSSALLDRLDFVTSGAKRRKTSDVDAAATKDAVTDRAADKAADKAAAKAAQALAKQEAKLAKEIERSRAAKDKEVNKLRTSKNDTVREIHVYISSDLDQVTSPIAAALPELRARLTDNSSKLVVHDSLPHLVRFKRHVQARYDPAAKKWTPIDPVWEWETTSVLVTSAEEIVDYASTDRLDPFIADTQLQLGGELILLIKDLNKYHTKTKTLANREFTAAVRGTAVKSSTRLSREAIEQALITAQILHGCFYVHVEKTEDIEDWLFNLAADVAIRPYKLLQKAHLAPTDGIRKGSTPTGTLELMLQEIPGITPSAAKGIAFEYPTFRDLQRAFERADDPASLLSECRVSNLKNGTANGRKLGKALAQKVYITLRVP